MLFPLSDFASTLQLMQNWFLLLPYQQKCFWKDFNVLHDVHSNGAFSVLICLDLQQHLRVLQENFWGGLILENHILRSFITRVYYFDKGRVMTSTDGQSERLEHEDYPLEPPFSHLQGIKKPSICKLCRKYYLVM